MKKIYKNVTVTLLNPPKMFSLYAIGRDTYLEYYSMCQMKLYNIM